MTLVDLQKQVQEIDAQISAQQLGSGELDPMLVIRHLWGMT